MENMIDYMIGEAIERKSKNKNSKYNYHTDGVNIIANERNTHDSKHNFNLLRDYKLYYNNNQLQSAAMYCLTFDV